MSDTVRIQLEKGLATARNKRITGKQYAKQLRRHHWQQDGDRMHVLRDYMSKHADFVNKSFSDVYCDLTHAKDNVIAFMDLYVEALYKMNQVRLEPYKQKRKENS
jgi:Iap family predicted aminopeptidase